MANETSHPCPACGATIDDAKPFIRCARAASGECPEVSDVRSLAARILETADAS